MIVASSAVGSATLAVLGLFWLFGVGLLAPALFARRPEQDRQPERFEHLRATSTYRPVQPTPHAHQLARRFRA